MRIGFDALRFTPSIEQQQQYAAVKESLDKAEEIFDSFATASQADKDTMTQHLGKAYQQLRLLQREATEEFPSQLCDVAARIFFLYGRCLYGGDMQASRRMFELSFIIDLISLKTLRPSALPPLPSDDTLTELPKTFSPHAFSEFDMFLNETPTDLLVDLIGNQDDTHTFNTATTLRNIEATYQNIDSFNDKQFLPLFQKICDVPKRVWEKINSQDSVWEVALLIYNTGRHLVYLNNPDDVEGAIATLKELEPYLAREGLSKRAQQLRAQVHNITAIELYKLYKKKLAQGSITKEEKEQLLHLFYEKTVAADNIASTTPDIDRFLKLLFRHNKASRALECAKEGYPVATTEEVGLWFQQVVKIIREENYSHIYHPIFLTNAAKFERSQQHLEQALALLDEAKMVAQKYPDSCSDMLEAAEKLHAEILQEMTKK